MKFFEKFFSFIYGVQIALSPIFIGLVVGVIVWSLTKDDLGLISGGLCIVAGIIVGVVWAVRIYRKHGTIEFMARIDGTPELNESEDAKLKTDSTDKQ